MSIHGTIIPALLASGLLAAGLLAAGCSSDTNGSPSTQTASPTPTGSSTVTPTTSSTASTTTVSTAPITASGTASSSAAANGAPSVAALHTIVLRRGDLPSGWTAGPDGSDGSDDSSVDTQLAACIGTADTSDRDQVHDVHSDDFSKGALSISSDASSYRSQADVRNQVALLRNPKAQSCLNSVSKKELSGSVPSPSDIKAVAVALDTGHVFGIDNVVGLLDGHITVAAQNRSTTAYVRVAFITGRQLTAGVSVTSVGAPVGLDVIRPLVAAVARRAANA